MNSRALWRKGAEFTLTRINMFGNSNSLHLTSLCEKKSRETFDNDIFHMIRARWKSAFERQWSPGKLFVDHTTTVVLRLSGLRGMRNSFGKQINSSFSWRLHWEWEREREEKKKKGNREGEMSEGGNRKQGFYFKLTSFWYHLWTFSQFFIFKFAINDKRIFMSLYSHMQMPLFHVNTRLAFPTGVAQNGRFFVFPNLTTMSSGMQFSATRKFRRTDPPPPLRPPSSRFPIISCFYFIRESLQKQWPSFFQKCFACLRWIYLN